jgi:hypothetical protein
MDLNHSNSALRAELGNCLRGLQQSLRNLSEHVQSDGRDAWVWQLAPAGPSGTAERWVDFSPARTREEIAEAYLAIKYVDGQGLYESRTAPGLIVVNEEGIALAEAVNHYKRGLARVLAAMKGRVETGVIDQRTGEKGERPLSEVALEAFYFARLHHHQATREIKILRPRSSAMGTPEYVSFMWARSDDVRRKSREEWIERLMSSRTALETPGLLSEDLAALRALPAGEPLAFVRPSGHEPKANVFWPDDTGGPQKPRIWSALIPLVMLGQQLPRLRKLPPTPTPDGFRMTRRDVEIDHTPFLKTLPVHRYLPAFREEKRAALRKKASAQSAT